MSSPSPRRWTAYLRYMGLFIFVAVVITVGPEKAWQSLQSARPELILAAMILNFPHVALKALRWRILTMRAGIHIDFPTSVKAYFSSLLLGAITPARVGEFVRVAYAMDRSAASLATAFPPAILDRVFDLCLIMVLGVLGLARFSVLSPDAGVYLLIIFLAGLCFPYLISRRFVGDFIVALLGRIRFGGHISPFLEEIQRQLADLDLVLALKGLGLTILAYSIFFIQCHICALSVGINMAFMDLVLLMSATNLVLLAPVTISGVGVREIFLVATMASLGVSGPDALAFSLIIFIVLNLGNGLIGAFCWWVDPPKGFGLSKLPGQTPTG